MRGTGVLLLVTARGGTVTWRGRSSRLCRTYEPSCCTVRNAGLLVKYARGIVRGMENNSAYDETYADWVTNELLEQQRPLNVWRPFLPKAAPLTPRQRRKLDRELKRERRHENLRVAWAALRGKHDCGY